MMTWRCPACAEQYEYPTLNPSNAAKQSLLHYVSAHDPEAGVVTLVLADEIGAWEADCIIGDRKRDETDRINTVTVPPQHIDHPAGSARPVRGVRYRGVAGRLLAWLRGVRW